MNFSPARMRTLNLPPRPLGFSYALRVAVQLDSIAVRANF